MINGRRGCHIAWLMVVIGTMGPQSYRATENSRES